MNKLFVFILILLPFFTHAQDEEEQVKQASMAELSRSVENATRAVKNAESQGDKKVIAHRYGDLGNIYIQIAKVPSEQLQPSVLVAADKKGNLAKAMECLNKSADLSDQVGDMDQMIAAYKSLRTAQNMAGRKADAISTTGKITTLKHAILNPKKAKEIERRQADYLHQKQVDSINAANKRNAEIEKQRLAEKDKQIEATQQNLSAAEKEKQNVTNRLQQTQTDLNAEKSVSEEKTRQLTQAEQEKALKDAEIELKQSKLQLAQNEVENQKKALEQRRKEQYFYLAGTLLMLGFSLLIYRSFKVQKKFNTALLNEKKRSEELLLNILPAEVAEELMQKGFTDAKHFYDVTVLFTDFVNFTSVAETMLPQQLVGELHVCFKAFDMILSKYRIEKIKTVGDAYMAVSGLPISNPNHATDIAAAALEIRDFMAKRKLEMGNSTFGIRIGINSGNVVAGIVGVRKFAYDIWGDTVNIAARMEQNSEEGKINISEATYQLVKEKYVCEPRGKIQAKNKGGIDMYYLAEAADHVAQASEILAAPKKA